ncbi:MAG: hypothetical protein ACREMY_16435, partial [bacterium]
GASIGDRSSMAALLQEEGTGQPTIGPSGTVTWHYNKVWDAQNGLQSWFDKACKYINDMEECQYYRDLTPAEVARLAQVSGDLAVVARLLGYINTAINAWESSPYHTGTKGQNPPLPMPFASAQPLPAPSSGVPVQPALPPAEGIPAQPATLPPVPGIAPTHQMPPGFWQLEQWSTVRLPDVPGFPATTIPGTGPSGPSFPVVPIPQPIEGEGGNIDVGIGIGVGIGIAIAMEGDGGGAHQFL